MPFGSGKTSCEKNGLIEVNAHHASGGSGNEKLARLQGTPPSPAVFISSFNPPPLLYLPLPPPVMTLPQGGSHAISIAFRHKKLSPRRQNRP